MPSASFSGLLVVVAVAFAAPLALGLFPRLRLPSVVLEITVGIAIGPSILGWVHADLPIQVLSVIGLAFLLFLAGMEIEFERLRGHVMRLAGLSFAMSFLVGLGVGYTFWALGLVKAPLLVAIILSATSLGLVIPVLKDAGEITSGLGQLAIASASVADFGAVTVLSLFFSRARAANRQPAKQSGLAAGDIGRNVGLRALTVAASLAVILTACGGPSSSSNTATGKPGDFAIVAYQGADVFGGKQSRFARVFEQGKPVVLNFWAGLCPPCRAEMPGFQKVSAELSGKVLFVGIDIGEFVNLGTHQDAVNLYTQLGIRYPLAYAVDSPLKLYHVQGMPTTVFLSSTGKVVEQITGILTEDQLRSIIQQKLLVSP